MRTRSVILAGAVALVAASALPAQAAIPSCASYSALAPYRVAFTGPDMVKANFTMQNNCGVQRWLVGLTIETKRCAFLVGCNWAEQSFISYNVQPGAYSTMDIYGDCREGKNRYRMVYELRDAANQAFIGSGVTAEPELTCDNDVPVDACSGGGTVRPQLPICKQ